MRAEILAARDAREAALARSLARAPRAATVLFASTALPGPCKTPPGSGALFGWGLGELAARLGRLAVAASDRDALGPYAILVTAEPADAVKRACIAIEDAMPAARLLDLDVHRRDGTRLGRTDLGGPPRACLVCDRPAVECIRRNHHSLDRVIDHAHRLLAGLAGPAPC